MSTLRPALLRNDTPAGSSTNSAQPAVTSRLSSDSSLGAVSESMSPCTLTVVRLPSTVVVSSMTLTIPACTDLLGRRRDDSGLGPNCAGYTSGAIGPQLRSPASYHTMSSPIIPRYQTPGRGRTLHVWVQMS